MQPVLTSRRAKCRFGRGCFVAEVRAALYEKMTAAGAFVFAGGLLPESASVVRQSGDDILITDGPYTETKEHLGGFWIIEAADLDVALEWARQATVACRMPVEVTPFDERDGDAMLAAFDGQ